MIYNNIYKFNIKKMTSVIYSINHYYFSSDFSKHPTICKVRKDIILFRNIHSSRLGEVCTLDEVRVFLSSKRVNAGTYVTDESWPIATYAHTS